MKQPSKKNYQADLIIQGVFYLPMMLFYLLGFAERGFFILGALLQLGVGASQVISGAIHLTRFQDELHRRYFFGAISYLLFLFIGANFYSGGDLTGMFFLFVIPVSIATWYYYITWNGYKNAVEEFSTTINKMGYGEEDVLDDVLL